MAFELECKGRLVVGQRGKTISGSGSTIGRPFRGRDETFLRKLRKTDLSGPESEERPGWRKGWGERQAEEATSMFRITTFILRAKGS